MLKIEGPRPKARTPSGREADEQLQNKAAVPPAQGSDPRRVSERTIRIVSWGKHTAVELHPRRVDLPTRSFRHEPDAVAYAEKLAAEHGWPIEDRRS